MAQTPCSRTSQGLPPADYEQKSVAKSFFPHSIQEQGQGAEPRPSFTAPRRHHAPLQSGAHRPAARLPWPNSDPPASPAAKCRLLYVLWATFSSAAAHGHRGTFLDSSLLATQEGRLALVLLKAGSLGSGHRGGRGPPHRSELHLPVFQQPFQKTSPLAVAAAPPHLPRHTQ